MVFVPGGPFPMGSSAETATRLQQQYGGGLSLYTAEVPRHEVRVDGFWIDRTEVTNRAYAEFVRATGHRAPGEAAGWAKPYCWHDGVPPADQLDHPVTLVSFDDAQAFCRWRGARLPSEAEWEKAACGTDGRAYPWGDRYDASRVAGAQRRSQVRLDRIERWTDWWRSHYVGRMRGREVGTFRVGSLPAGASPYGALDMAGNVFEWVDARFEPYPESPFSHPDYAGGYTVVRGGDWYLDRIYHRCAARLRAPAGHRVPTIGFRCAGSEQTPGSPEGGSTREP
jgi:formylglycine-generating enzyme required for sulfatase activity